MATTNTAAPAQPATAPQASTSTTSPAVQEIPKKHVVDLLRIHVFEAKIVASGKFTSPIKPYVIVECKGVPCRTSNSSEIAIEKAPEENRVTWNEHYTFLLDTKKTLIPIAFYLNDANRDKSVKFLGNVIWEVPRFNDTPVPGATSVSFPVRDMWLPLEPRRKEDGFKGSLHVNADISSIEEFDKQGILLKRGDALFQTWARRYFLIKDNYLFWFKLKSSIPRGYFDVSETKVEKFNIDAKNIFPIRITKKNDTAASAEPCILAALSEQEREDWIVFLAKGSLVKRAVDQKTMIEPPTRKYSIFGNKMKPDLTQINKIKSEEEEEKEEKEAKEKEDPSNASPEAKLDFKEPEPADPKKAETPATTEASSTTTATTETSTATTSPPAAPTTETSTATTTQPAAPTTETSAATTPAADKTATEVQTQS